MLLVPQTPLIVAVSVIVPLDPFVRENWLLLDADETIPEGEGGAHTTVALHGKAVIEKLCVPVQKELPFIDMLGCVIETEH